MALGLFDKLTNFLMPVEEEDSLSEPINLNARRPHLKVHSPAALKVFIATPQGFDDVRVCADYLKANIAVLINYEHTDPADQQRIGDFLNGVCFVTGGTNQQVSDTVLLYAPANVEINKELYAYSIPTYVKRK